MTALRHVAARFFAAICVFAAACSTSPAARPAGRDLQTRLSDALAPVVAAGAAVSFLVVDGRSGAVLASHRPAERVVPASTQKLLTAAAVLRFLPPDRRLTTRLVGPPVDAAGSLPGDLWLVGDGDPSLGSARGAAGAPPGEMARNDVLLQLAEGLRRAGVTRIGGGVVGDGRVLPAPALLPGWSWDDVAYAYSALPAGLTVYEGSARLDVSVAGTTVLLDLDPKTRQVQLFLSPELPEKDGLWLWPGMVPGQVLVQWRAPQGRLTARDFVAVPDPPLFAAEQLTEALENAGITVGQGPRTPRAGESLSDGITHASVDSPPLRELCTLMMRDSLNLHAETLLMNLGRLLSGDGSTRGGLKLVAELLHEGRHDPESFRIVDGSGLSRMNLLSAEVLVDVLRRAVAADRGFVDVLATAGRSGTLHKRLVGTPAEGRVHAKTGLLTGHRNMVGIVDAVDGRQVFFAVMLSGVVPPRAIVDAAVDQALITLLLP